MKQNISLSNSQHKQINRVRGRFGRHELVKKQPDRQENKTTRKTDKQTKGQMNIIRDTASS